jgi:hypothetical protein
LFPTKTSMAGKIMDCVRIKAAKAANVEAKQAPAKTGNGAPDFDDDGDPGPLNDGPSSDDVLDPPF